MHSCGVLDVLLPSIYVSFYLLHAKVVLDGYLKKLKVNLVKKKGNKSGSKKLSTDVDVYSFLHRCMGYSIVVCTFLHLICVYFTYEDSLATHTFIDIYGWECFGTGWFALFLLASIVASSNDTLSKQNKRLFHQTHWQSIILIFVLIIHGSGFISTYYWQLIIVPLVFYSCHLFIRYLKGH